MAPPKDDSCDTPSSRSGCAPPGDSSDRWRYPASSRPRPSALHDTRMTRLARELLDVRKVAEVRALEDREAGADRHHERPVVEVALDAGRRHGQHGRQTRLAALPGERRPPCRADVEVLQLRLPIGQVPIRAAPPGRAGEEPSSVDGPSRSARESGPAPAPPCSARALRPARQGPPGLKDAFRRPSAWPAQLLESAAREADIGALRSSPEGPCAFRPTPAGSISREIFQRLKSTQGSWWRSLSKSTLSGRGSERCPLWRVPGQAPDLAGQGRRLPLHREGFCRLRRTFAVTSRAVPVEGDPSKPRRSRVGSWQNWHRSRRALVISMTLRSWVNRRPSLRVTPALTRRTPGGGTWKRSGTARSPAHPRA